MVSRHDLISAYHQRLKDIRAMDENKCAGSNVFDHAATHGAFESPRRKIEKIRKKTPSSVSQAGLELIEDLPEDTPR